ncbi:MAG: glycosyltransferase family 9 protein [Candidatus Krumholzibacteriia bacterium]
MSQTLVIRFGSLGDLCLLGWALARRHDERAAAGVRPDPVTLVTKPAFAALAAGFRGVGTVMAPEDTSALAVAQLARRLAGLKPGTVVDAHNVLRGHLLLGLMGRRPDRRLAKDTVARLALLRSGRTDPRLDRTMVDRFDELFAGDRPPAAGPGPAPVPPLIHLRPAAAAAGPVLGLAPGAQWDTKRWPEDRFAAVLAHHLDRTAGTARLFLGPREESWFAGSDLAAAAAASENRVDVIRGGSLPEVAAGLGTCHAVLTNDSGLLHLAEAVGTPVVALFGPTVRAFGYFPRLPASRVLERSLDCRPCSRNGKRPCHRGDLACLTGIGADEVCTAVAAVLGEGVR